MQQPKRKPEALPAGALFAGIGGMGMRGLAELWQRQGVAVAGTDDAPEALNAPALAGFSLSPAAEAAALLAQAGCLIYSDAVPDDHPLRAAARQQRLTALSYQEALGIFSRQFRTLVVTGTHGKSSTTALLAHLCTEAGLDPTALVGAPMPAWGGKNARTGVSDLFIVEGDEYREHFLTLSWHAAVIVSVDFDHPDYFSSLEDVEQAYSRFLVGNPDGWTAARQEVIERHPAIAWPANVQAVSDDPGALAVPALPGEHMQRNATLALAAAVWAGAARAAAVRALASFPGVGRRFELLGDVHGLPLVSDYGHHPAEIAATLAAARERFAGGKILVLWEPHTLERLQLFSDDFAAALAGADAVLLLPTYQPGGREGKRAADNAAARQTILQRLALQGVAVQEIDDLAETGGRLHSLAPDFTAGICFSAGQADAYLRDLIAAAGR